MASSLSKGKESNYPSKGFTAVPSVLEVPTIEQPDIGGSTTHVEKIMAVDSVKSSNYKGAWLFPPDKKVTVEGFEMRIFSYHLSDDGLELTFLFTNMRGRTIGIGLLPRTFLVDEFGNEYYLIDSISIEDGCNSVGVWPPSMEGKASLRFSLIFPKEAATAKNLRLISKFGINDSFLCDQEIAWEIENIKLSDAVIRQQIESFSLEEFDSSTLLKDFLPHTTGQSFHPNPQSFLKFSTDPDTGLSMSRTRLIIHFRENVTVEQAKTLLQKIDGEIVGGLSGGDLFIDIPESFGLKKLKKAVETLYQSGLVDYVSEDTKMGTVG